MNVKRILNDISFSDLKKKLKLLSQTFDLEIRKKKNVGISKATKLREWCKRRSPLKKKSILSTFLLEWN